MNFDNMPELHWKFGYLYCILSMVASSGILYVIFRKKQLVITRSDTGSRYRPVLGRMAYPDTEYAKTTRSSGRVAFSSPASAKHKQQRWTSESPASLYDNDL
ncbi:hypothetical protein JCM18909_2230 [Cutibacterium acnes JCM 18909]|nr:hypothetical protein JCM18909_2230 [Cutibacterium acnes JCM 18909]